MASGSSWNYHRDQVNDAANKYDAANNKINKTKTATSRSFEYKTRLIRRTSVNIKRLNVEIAVS